MPKESNVTLVPHITFIRPNTLLVKAVMTLFWVNTKRKTVMTLIRIVLLSNGCAVITLFKIYLKRVMTDPFTFECHYSLLDHVKLKLQSWLSFGTMFFSSVESWLSLGPLLSQSVLPLPSFRTCLSFGTRVCQFDPLLQRLVYVAWLFDSCVNHWVPAQNVIQMIPVKINSLLHFCEISVLIQLIRII